MNTKEINPLVLIGVAVVVLVLLGFGLFRAAQPPAPPRGSYTPGVPPWMEKNGKTDAGVHRAPGQPAPAASPR